MASILLGLSLLWLFVVPVGWQLGYRSFLSYVTAWLLSVLVVLPAFCITRRAFPSVGFADAAIRTTIIAFAIIVACGLLLGSAGRLATIPFFIVTALLSAAVVRPATSLSAPKEQRRQSWRPALAGLEAIPTIPMAVIPAVAVFVVAYGMTHAPFTLYDSLSYHLFFPARWLQEHRLSIIATPFSDEAQAYAPGNGELFLLWLMLPFHGDLVARIGQFPFCFAGGVALFALARRIGARREHAAYSALFFLLARPVVEQAVGANVDLICAATFLMSLYLGIIAIDRDEPRDWIIWGVSVGLFCGTKYVALVYLPVLLLIPFIRGMRIKAIWAVPACFVFAAPWYLRNWVTAGSPIYPASVAAAGLTLARGAFGRAAMLDTVFHADNIRLLAPVAIHGFGATLFFVWLVVAAIAIVFSAARRQWWPSMYVLVLPFAMTLLEWIGIPVNVDSRFLLPAVAVAMLPFALTFGRHRVWNGAVHGVYAIAIVWMVVGRQAEIPATLPWYMGGWLSLTGLVPSRFLVWFAGVAIICAASWRLAIARPRWMILASAGVSGVLAVALAIGAGRWCAPACDYLDTSSPFIRANYGASWRWISEHVHHATFAYTGINLPYPLTGDALTNRVYYVNIDRHRDWRFHDYARSRRGQALVSEEGRLARASGELVPIGARARAAGEALRPRYERMIGDRTAWIDNLKALGIDHLFVASMSAYEIDYVWHNDGGFPIEDEWAKSDRQMFQIVYENPQVHIYTVDFTRREGA